MTLPITEPNVTKVDAAQAELADFVAYEAQLTTHIAGFATLRRQVRFFPLFALVTAPFGFFYASWVPPAIAFTWLSFWGATLYITWMRSWQYKGERERIRSEVARLRGALRVTPE